MSTSLSCDSELELIFLGTGTSSSLPHIECLTAPPSSKPCKTCLSTLRPEGKKNIRRNTSAVIRVHEKKIDGKQATIVIDVGKNFQAAALEWFPKYGLRRIDAVLITHAHADAMNGLDDLRGWTLNQNIQPFIDIYCSQLTFIEVQRAFPYLVAKEFASGGGDVPEFRWHIIDDKVPFEVGDTGITVTPFAVYHGRIFRQSPPLGNLPTPAYTSPPTPVSGRSSPHSPPLIISEHLNDSTDVHASKIKPYICFGFKVEDAIVYISDVSHIPEDVWPLLLEPAVNGQRTPVFVVDCLRLTPHTSHFGIKDAVATVRRVNAERSYMTGFGHEISYEEYVDILKYAGDPESKLENMTENVHAALNLIADEAGIPRRQCIKPAYDGLRIRIAANGGVRDDTDA